MDQMLLSAQKGPVRSEKMLEASGAQSKYFALMYSERFSQGTLSFRIPGTVVIKRGRVSSWYQSGEDGTLRRKKYKEASATAILADFVKHPELSLCKFPGESKSWGNGIKELVAQGWHACPCPIIAVFAEMNPAGSVIAPLSSTSAKSGMSDLSLLGNQEKSAAENGGAESKAVDPGVGPGSSSKQSNSDTTYHYLDLQALVTLLEGQSDVSGILQKLPIPDAQNAMAFRTTFSGDGAVTVRGIRNIHDLLNVHLPLPTRGATFEAPPESLEPVPRTHPGHDLVTHSARQLFRILQPASIKLGRPLQSLICQWQVDELGGVHFNWVVQAQEYAVPSDLRPVQVPKLRLPSIASGSSRRERPWHSSGSITDRAAQQRHRHISQQKHALFLERQNNQQVAMTARENAHQKQEQLSRRMPYAVGRHSAARVLNWHDTGYRQIPSMEIPEPRFIKYHIKDPAESGSAKRGNSQRNQPRRPYPEPLPPSAKHTFRPPGQGMSYSPARTQQLYASRSRRVPSMFEEVAPSSLLSKTQRLRSSMTRDVGSGISISGSSNGTGQQNASDQGAHGFRSQELSALEELGIRMDEGDDDGQEYLDTGFPVRMEPSESS